MLITLSRPDTQPLSFRRALESGMPLHQEWIPASAGMTHV